VKRVRLIGPCQAAKPRANLWQLLKLAQHAKAAVLFDGEERSEQKRLTDKIAKLACLRNKLLHQGEKEFLTEDIVEMTLAVDAAIEWLFR